METNNKQLKHLSDGFISVVSGQNATIIGFVKAGNPYYIGKGAELVSSPTLEELKATLTERGLKFNETPLRPVSQ
jgi:hypothetical protein